MKRNDIRRTCHTLSEYLLLGALIVAVSIPALMLLGNSTGLNLELFARSKAVKNPMGIATGGNAGVYKLLLQKMTGAQSANTAGEFQSVYDPATGTLRFPMANMSGDSRDTAGSSGDTTVLTREMARQMSALADSWQSPEGENLAQMCPACSEALKRMAAQADRLAREEEVVNQKHEKRKLDPAFPRPNYWGVEGATRSFSEEYQAFNDAVRQHLADGGAELPGLSQKADSYAGVTSSLALKNYLLAITPDSYGDKMPDLVSYAVGTPPAGLDVSRRETPTVTRKAGDSLDSLSR